MTSHIAAASFASLFSRPSPLYSKGLCGIFYQRMVTDKEGGKILVSVDFLEHQVYPVNV